jgi:pimeloyl-ACP methyl ester carboxylesterase
MKQLEAHGGQIEYEHAGDGATVLLIHGAIASDALAPLMTAPALDGVHRVRYRRRAYATGYQGPLPVTIEEDARDAIALLDHLQVGAATIVGYSHGALVGIEIAHQAPERVRGHVFLEAGVASALPSAAEAGEVFGPIVERYHAGDAHGAVDALSVAIFGDDYEPVVRRALGDDGLARVLAEARPTFEGDLPAQADWSLADAAAGVTQPVLHVIGGNSDDTYMKTIGLPLGSEAQGVVVEHFPQTREQVVPDLNHLMALADPDGVADAIAGFVAEIDAPTTAR